MRQFPAAKVLDIIKSIPSAVYAPVEDGSMVVFNRYEDGMTLRLDKVATDKTPKDILFPQWENLMHFRVEGKTIELTEEKRQSEDYVVFGVRGCDLQAFKVLDKVFLSDPIDTYYAARREHGTVVALACTDMKDSCFCKNFGVDPANPDADVVLWLIGDDYYCEAYTDKGRALMERWPTQEAEEAAVEGALDHDRLRRGAGELHDRVRIRRLRGGEAQRLVPRQRSQVRSRQAQRRHVRA